MSASAQNWQGTAGDNMGWDVQVLHSVSHEISTTQAHFTNNSSWTNFTLSLTFIWFNDVWFSAVTQILPCLTSSVLHMFTFTEIWYKPDYAQTQQRNLVSLTLVTGTWMQTGVFASDSDKNNINPTGCLYSFLRSFIVRHTSVISIKWIQMENNQPCPTQREYVG